MLKDGREITAQEKPPHQKLREDLQAVRDAFADPEFRGRFDMELYGYHSDEHEPNAHNYCGTQCCLAGWLATLGKNDFRGKWTHGSLMAASGHKTFVGAAIDIYGMTKLEGDALFLSGFGSTLEQKLAEADALADAIEARSSLPAQAQ